jgi:hypothetical protein
MSVRRQSSVSDRAHPGSVVAPSSAGVIAMRAMDRRTVFKGAVLAAFTSSLAGSVGAPARAAAPDPAVAGSWTAPFDLGGIAIHMTLTQVGDILFFQYVEGDPTADHTSFVGTWNHRTGVSAEAPFTYHRDVFCAGHTVLPDGRIFIAGGHDHNTGSKQSAVGVAETDFYDPTTRTWAPGPLLTQKRWYPTAVSLANGKVLIFGGLESTDLASDAVDEYDSVTNTMRQLPATATQPLGTYPRMHLMPNGQLLLSGPAREAAWFDPATSSWRNGGAMLFGRRTRGNSVLLPGATRLLAVGGQSSGTSAPTATAEIFDTAAASPAWRVTGSMNIGRCLANTVNLPDGQILIVGGGAQFKYTGPVTTPEIYDPVTETWTALAPQQAGRMYHSTALLLPDGRVLSAGQDSGSLATFGEIFSPPYLFKGSRPTITGAPSTVGYGQQLTISSPEAAGISAVTLIKAGSVTHEIDTDQRAVPLSFAAGAGTLTAQVPTNTSLLPPGYYMLFIVDRNGVPSVAPWVRVG